MIPKFNSSINKSIAILGVLLFFTPKINLINIQQGESAGIRLDDILIGILCIFLICGFYTIGRSTLTRFEFLFGLLVASFLISNLINISLWKQSNILYSLRYIEYFFFFYIGYYYSSWYKITDLIFWMLLINGVIMILQALNLVGGFSSAGFSNSTSDRAIGLTGGPWEVGTIINFIFAIYLFDKNEYSSKKINIIFLVTFSLIMLSGARMPTVAHLLLFLIYKYFNSKNKFFFVLSSCTYALLIISLVIFIPNPVTDRSAKLFSTENINQFFYTYKQIRTTHPFNGFPETDDLNVSGDLSWLMRISKWTYAIKGFISSPYSWFIGLGPGVWGLALDGGWVRLLTECGIIGTSFFILFFRKAVKLGKPVLGVVISLYINMLMIDINISYKAMAFVFFVVGYYYQKRISTNLVTANDGN
jgi:hypothetical protein